MRVSSHSRLNDLVFCEASGASPQAALRSMAAMLCGLRYDADNRLVPLDDPAA
jgi:hypothetical protein